MSRLYLTFIFSLLCISIFGQSKLKAYLKYADEKFNSGDYYYALELYEKAMELDSNSVSILWNYAETLRMYKDYRKAAIYYQKVYEKENAAIYPLSLTYLGLMQKQNGDYDNALETFKKSKKKSSKNKKDYRYLKANQEIESCLWAKNNLKDTLNVKFVRLPEAVNTANSEFGHTIHENKLIYSSLRADSIGMNEETYSSNYFTKLYESEIKNDSFENGTESIDLNQPALNVGNGSFSPDGKRFYFSACKNNGINYQCKIMVASFEDGKFSAIDSLGSIINEPGANTTMPSVGILDQKEVLFFASDRKGTKGGMDIWYSVIKNENQYADPVNLKTINSIENELSPWWDSLNKRLYFSSNWLDGFGGYDIFYTIYSQQFETPHNLGIPFNSPANDLYFFKYGDSSFVTSNREGVMFSKNPTCCSDIFIAIEEKHKKEFDIDITPNIRLINELLPVALYFHNDCPNPRSNDTITKQNYLKTYQDYRALLGKYQHEYSTGLNHEEAEEAKEEIEIFFMEFVDEGIRDLDRFCELLLSELNNGARLMITIQGFASPLATSDYNLNLTKRRISSFVNFLSEYGHGEFISYLADNAPNRAALFIRQIPFGEYQAQKFVSDNFHDQKNSVYSRAAAMERKIAIQRVDYIH